MGTASDALGITLSKGVKDADSILASYRRLTSVYQQMQPMELQPGVIKMPSFRINNLRYDDLFRKEASHT